MSETAMFFACFPVLAAVIVIGFPVLLTLVFRGGPVMTLDAPPESPPVRDANDAEYWEMHDRGPDDGEYNEGWLDALAESPEEWNEYMKWLESKAYG